MSESLVTIAKFSDSFLAHLAQMKLEENDIKSIIVGENLIASYPESGPLRVEIQVLSSDAKLALEILESKEKQEQ